MRHQFNDFFHVASNKVLPIQECSEKKERYDTCFIKWYSESTGPSLAESLWRNIQGTDSGKLLEYLRGESQTDECKDLFKEYQICLNVSFKPYARLFK